MRGAGCWRNVPGREDKILRTQWVGSPEGLPRSVAGPQRVGSHTGPGLGREGNKDILRLRKSKDFPGGPVAKAALPMQGAQV